MTPRDLVPDVPSLPARALRRAEPRPGKTSIRPARRRRGFPSIAGHDRPWVGPEPVPGRSIVSARRAWRSPRHGGAWVGRRAAVRLDVGPVIAMRAARGRWSAQCAAGVRVREFGGACQAYGATTVRVPELAELGAASAPLHSFRAGTAEPEPAPDPGRRHDVMTAATATRGPDGGRSGSLASGRGDRRRPPP